MTFFFLGNLDGLDPAQRKKLDPFYNVAGGGVSKNNVNNNQQPPVIYTTLGTQNHHQNPGGSGGGGGGRGVKDRLGRMYNRMMKGGGGSGGSGAGHVSSRHGQQEGLSILGFFSSIPSSDLPRNSGLDEYFC